MGGGGGMVTIADALKVAATAWTLAMKSATLREVGSDVVTLTFAETAGAWTETSTWSAFETAAANAWLFSRATTAADADAFAHLPRGHSPETVKSMETVLSRLRRAEEYCPPSVTCESFTWAPTAMECCSCCVFGGTAVWSVSTEATGMSVTVMVP